MKNIKKPSYAVNLGKGVFVGTKYQCLKCGKQIDISWTPAPTYPIPCTESSNKNHVWQKM